MAKFNCRCTLDPIGNDGFSPAASRKLSGGRKKIPFRLDFSRMDVVTYRAEKAKRLSISGVQDKVSLKLRNGRLEPVSTDGEFILKPIPSVPIPIRGEDIPANEHLTMTLAERIFGMEIPPRALVTLSDGEPAYLVRRFDRDGSRKIPQEDFCQLSNRSEGASRKNYKYDGTMEETGRILKKHCSAYAVEKEKLFTLHVFNYLISNGDAHLKNFSLRKTEFGDYVMTPGYDLLCTSTHIPNESRCALEMFDEDETEFFKNNGFYGRDDFLLLAEKFEIERRQAKRIMNRFIVRRDDVVEMVGRSFLSSASRKDYVARYDDRIKAIKN